MTPKRFQKIKDMLKRRQPDLTVITDNVHKPHNLAAIIRSCDAVGIGDIYCLSKNEEKVGVNLKAASGTNRWVKMHIFNSATKFFKKLKSDGFKIYIANNNGISSDFRDVDYTVPTAIALGAELDGISQELKVLSDHEISIPMNGMAENLNVSVANAIILFEIQRQREIAGLYKKTRLCKTQFDKLLFEFSYPKLANVFNKKGEKYPALDEVGQIIK